MSTEPASSHARQDPDSYYSFGPFQLNPQSRLLTKAGVRVPITAKALEVLLILLERSGETLTKAHLRAAVWGSLTIDDNNLNQCISAIRKALGERAGQHEYIVTVTGVGYRFVAPVVLTDERSASPSLPVTSIFSNRQRIVFATLAVVVFVLLASSWIINHNGAPHAGSKLAPLPLSQNEQALQFYLAGRRVARDRRAPDLNRAIQYFKSAVTKDPNFALAYTWLGETYAIEVANGITSPDMLKFGEAAADKALALDPNLADAHASLALLKYSRWDWGGANRELTTALRLDPNNSRALMRSAMVSFVLGRFPEAESLLGRAQVLDPSNGSITGMLGELYYYQRRYDAAIQQAEHIMQFDPANVAFAWDLMAKALLQEGRISEARVAAQKDATLSPNNIGSQLMLAWVNASGNSAMFAPVFHHIVETRSAGYSSPYVLAGWYARQNDKENTFRQLETAYHQHVTDLVSARWDPAFDSIRNDPRYSNLLVRMGLSDGDYSRHLTSSERVIRPTAEKNKLPSG